MPDGVAQVDRHAHQLSAPLRARQLCAAPGFMSIDLSPLESIAAPIRPDGQTVELMVEK
jgi:hypothetical protein